METHVILLQIVLILISARVVGEIFARFKIPSVLGELVAGIIIGPSLFGLVSTTPLIQLLAEIGIILLLFEVGIETDMGRLVSAGIKAVTVASVGVLLPLIFGFIISVYLFNLTFLTSLFIGCTLTATSIGITLRVLKELKKQDSSEAQIIIGAAVLDDVIGIILLAMLYEFSLSGVVNFVTAGKVLLFVTIFLIISPIAAKIISQVVRKWDQRCEIPGLLPTTIVALILFFAWIAHVLGAPELLGGFTAGLALSKHYSYTFFPFIDKSPEFTEKVEKQMRPIVHLFTPIFFVAIGLSLNLREIEWNSPFIWAITGVIFLFAILGKILSGFFLWGESFKSKLIVGVSMIPRGEVGLIFANVGLTAAVFTQDVYTAMILVITLTTLLAPILLRALIKG